MRPFPPHFPSSCRRVVFLLGSKLRNLDATNHALAQSRSRLARRRSLSFCRKLVKKTLRLFGRRAPPRGPNKNDSLSPVFLEAQQSNRRAADVALLSLQGRVAKGFSAAGFLRISSYGQTSTVKLLPSPASTSLPIIHIQVSAAELSSLHTPCELSSILRAQVFRFFPPSQLLFSPPRASRAALLLK